MKAAIVILGAAVWENAKPSPTLERRVNKAIELWETGKFDVIVASGGLGKNPPAESEIMQRLLSESGVPLSSIIKESQSNSTITNAVFSTSLLKEVGAKNVTIVTDGFHRLRTRMSFNRLGVCSNVVSADDSEPRPRIRVILRGWIREFFALPVYLLRLYLAPLPKLPEQTDENAH